MIFSKLRTTLNKNPKVGPNWKHLTKTMTKCLFKPKIYYVHDNCDLGWNCY